MLSRRQRLRGSVSRQISRDGRIFSMRWPFARKLIRPFGSVTAEDIQKEVKAITDICASGGHKNVIRFIDHGPLRASDYYYIDMEICQCNLDRYIYTPSRPLFRFYQDLVPTYSKEWKSVREHRKNVWVIMGDITAGLEFLHDRGYAHRDLKPRNGQSYPSLSIGFFFC